MVTGGSGSGKSEYGESLILDLNHSLKYYIATMEVFGEEGEEKVRRHRELRSGKGFVTLEWKRGLGKLRLGAGARRDRAVLLECVSNLAANEMFPGEGTRGCEDTALLAARLAEDIASVADQAADMVIITNEIGNDGAAYGQETLEYIRLMGFLNQRLADMADCVTEVVYGIPVLWKDRSRRELPVWKEVRR